MGCGGIPYAFGFDAYIKSDESITISREEHEWLLEENSALNRQLEWLMKSKKYGHL